MAELDPLVDQIVRRLEDRLADLKAGIGDLRVYQADMRRELGNDIGSVGQRLESRLDAHVDAPNPHPNLESWLRTRHDSLDHRVKRLETDRDVMQGERAAHAPLSRFLWTVLASVCAAAVTTAAAFALHLTP